MYIKVSSDIECFYKSGRFLYWTEDNRLYSVVDDNYLSYYTYDDSGERRLKLTGSSIVDDRNAALFYYASILEDATIYPSPYIVMDKKGYTKHYYAGTERICAKIGGGFGRHISESHLELQDTANSLFSQSRDDIQHRELPQNDLNCVVSYGHVRDEELRVPLCDMPNHLYTDADIDLGWFHHAVERCEREYEGEDKVFFYHSDHLGSASWITNKTGNAIQHLQYLPFGTPFVDQHAPGAGYSERFTFTGKERDEETGYGYFGARYMDHELMTMWLSVDPLADKYPSMSPYNYCAGNPVKLVDPDGKKIDPANEIEFSSAKNAVSSRANHYENQIAKANKRIEKYTQKGKQRKVEDAQATKKNAEDCIMTLRETLNLMNEMEQDEDVIFSFVNVSSEYSSIIPEPSCIEGHCTIYYDNRVQNYGSFVHEMIHGYRMVYKHMSTSTLTEEVLAYQGQYVMGAPLPTSDILPVNLKGINKEFVKGIYYLIQPVDNVGNLSGSSQKFYPYTDGGVLPQPRNTRAI